MRTVGFAQIRVIRVPLFQAEAPRDLNQRDWLTHTDIPGIPGRAQKKDAGLSSGVFALI